MCTTHSWPALLNAVLTGPERAFRRLVVLAGVLAVVVLPLTAMVISLKS